MKRCCHFLTTFCVFLYSIVPGIISQESKACSNDYDVRLTDGTSGQVEVCLNGTWGRVCDEGWDVYDAQTVCRQLGFNVTGIPTRRSLFSEVSGTNHSFHLINARCRRNDTRLLECDIDRTGVNNSCNHTEEAGAVCFQGSENCADGEVRLLGGTDQREGRVEICFSRFWWEVCGNGWDEVDANVVCSQLGYGNTAVVMNSFGSRLTAVILRNVSCTTSHSELFQCVSPEEVFAVPNAGRDSCGLDNRAGVRCVDPSSFITSPSTTDDSTTETVELAHNSLNILPLSVILGAVIGSIALVFLVIVFIVVVFVVRLMKRNITQEKHANKDNFGMKENEAYGTASQQRNVIVTHQNDAYGTTSQQIVTQQNEAYGTAQQRGAVVIQQNEALEDYVTVI